MNRRYLVIAGVCGAVTILLLILYLASQAPTKKKVQETEVVVAAAFIPDRKIISQDLLAVKKVPASQAQPGSFAEAGPLVGQVAIGDIKPGEQLTQSRVAPPGKDFGLAFVIPPSMRAITISLAESSGLRGLVLPGDRVDLLVTLESARYKSVLTFTLLRNVLILAIGDMLERPRGPLPKPGAGAQNESDLITLAVTPEEAEKVGLAIRKASLHLSLRPIETQNEVQAYLPGITMQQLEDEGYLDGLLSGYDVPGAGGPPGGRVIKAIRGTQVEEVTR